MKKISKSDAEKQIQEFFLNIKSKTLDSHKFGLTHRKIVEPKQVKKIKRLAMKHNIPLKELRKTFCKKCLSAYKNPKIRIKNKIKSITCGNCGHVARWRVKS